MVKGFHFAIPWVIGSELAATLLEERPRPEFGTGIRPDLKKRGGV
jgi:hypothetical protein